MPTRQLTAITAVVFLSIAMVFGFFTSPAFAQINNTRCITADDGTGREVCVTPSGKKILRGIVDLNTGEQAPEPNIAKQVGGSMDLTVGKLTGLFGGCFMGYENNKPGSCNNPSTAQNGVMGSLISYTTKMYTEPPASSYTYVADLLHNSHIIAQPAYAQGIGFASLTPILGAWKMFRDLAYLFFVLIFLAIGFMIMFRQKVGNAAVTAQQAIPQIIIALVAVTFSYAIAGLLIDGMYVIMWLLVGLFGQKSELIDKNFLQLGIYMLSQGMSSVGDIGSFVNDSFSSMGSIIATGFEWLSEITFALILVVAIVIGMFRLFFELLKTYVVIIINITMSPIILMMGAIPGRNVLSGWIKSLIGNLAAFPTVLLILIVYRKILDASGGDVTGGFLPPYLFGSASANSIPVLVGLGLILGMTEAVQKVKKALGADEGGAFGEVLKAGYGRVGKAADLAVPGALGVIQGVQGTADSWGKIKQSKQLMGDPSQGTGPNRERILKNLFYGYGYDTADGDDTKITGGLGRMAAKGFGRGQTIRRTVDDVLDGRFADPNNLYKVLREAQTPKKK